jgi:3',5'-cyclic AMP phosphodiesterase CpdA
VLPALVSDLHRQAADHVVVTGDLTNISLPSEFTNARRWLDDLGHPKGVSVVPGNHDAYIAVPWDRSLQHWSPFMSGVTGEDEEDEAHPESYADFPFLRLRGDVAILGVSTACPTPPGSAAGRIDKGQLSRLSGRLEELGRRGLFRVVLMHHPPLPGDSKPRTQLEESAAFREVIARHGAELVLFGHTHRSTLAKLVTPAGHAPAVGVPSASAKPHAGKDHARYHLYRIAREGNGWRLHVEVRGVTRSLDGFATEGRFLLSIPH